MHKFIQTTKPIWQESLWKALLACLLFVVLNAFSEYNFVRENVEDFAFDIINKHIISKQEQTTDSERVTVFVFDNEYMKNNGLFDDDKDGSQKDNKNIANYGYTFPREHIARFIDHLDTQIGQYQQISPDFCPTALFIDFDLRFPDGTSKNQMPLPNQLANGDQHLLKTLENPKRCYKLLLVQNSKFNYIKDYANSQLKALIKAEKISFVSPYFHASADGKNIVRRYEPIKKIMGETYPSAAIALWQISKTGKIDTQAIEQQFSDAVKKQLLQNNTTTSSKNRGNVNDNMIWIKHYKPATQHTCPEKSYWNQLQKYTIGCGQQIPPLDLENAILILGGTDKENTHYNPNAGDEHDVLSFIGTAKMSGVDIHANTLMTLFHLDQGKNVQKTAPVMKPLCMLTSLVIIFSSFFLVNFLIVYLLQLRGVDNKSLNFFLLFIINTTVLFTISVYFLNSEKHYWLNWAVTVVLYQLMEGLFISRKKLPLFIRIFLLKVGLGIKKWIIKLIVYLREIKWKINKEKKED